MRNITYVFAAIYQGIKNRRPGGTPYFNLRLLITFIVFLHIVHIQLGLKILFDIELYLNRNLFIFCFLLFGALSLFALNYIIPEEQLQNIAIEKSDINKMNWYSGLYFIACIILMVVLLVNLPPPNITSRY
jgi:hypothetical protein